MCPIETPEGPNIGLIGHLATYARVNEYGFIETPYRKVVDGRVTDEIVYLAADEEEEYVIAQANAELDGSGRFVDERVLVRRGPQGAGVRVGATSTSYGDDQRDRLRATGRGRPDGRLAQADRLGRRPRSSPSSSTTTPTAPSWAPTCRSRPCPWSCPRRPTSAPASRPAPPVTPGDVLLAEGDGQRRRGLGRPASSSSTGPARRTGSAIELGRKHLPARQVPALQPEHLHQPEGAWSTRAARSRPATCWPTGPPPTTASWPSGKNLLVAFMPWEGYNFEDAIILSERLVRDDVLTSIHIEEHEVDARDTKLGAEEITRDIPNLSEEILADLDERGHHPHRRRGRPRRRPGRQGHPEGRDRADPRGAAAAGDLRREGARGARHARSRCPTASPARSSTSGCSAREDSHELPPGRQPAGAGLRGPEAQDLRGRQARRAPRQQGRHLQDPARSRTCPSWPTAPRSTSS